MPILDDILDHEVLGPLMRKGRREGLKEGRCEMLSLMINKRFGKFPKSIQPRLAQMSRKELSALGLRLLDASSLKELFPQQ